MATSDKPHGRPVDSGRLEELGKQASRLSEVSGISLTEAARQTLAKEKLSAAQVRRVVEHCNTTAVNSKFAATMGLSVCHIDGGPADPEQVLEGLKFASESFVQIEAFEYSAPPMHEKRASAVSSLVPSVNLAELRDKLAAAHEELSSMADASSWQLSEAFEALQGAVKLAVRDGAHVAELYTAWAGIDPVMAKVAAAKFRDVHGWGTKVAGRRIVGEHPVLRSFEAFAKIATSYHQQASARKDVEAELARVDAHLRRAS